MHATGRERKTAILEQQWRAGGPGRLRSARRRLGRAWRLALLVTALGAAAASAQTIGNLSIHGAGGVAFGTTDGPNAYAAGTPEGAYDLRDLSLTLLATPSDRLLVGAQVYWGVRNIYTPNELELNLTQAFAQYKLSDALKVRAGVSRQPFGLYSETLEIGTLRPFLNLPRGVYSPGIFQWDGYRGLGITGVLAGESRWPVEYDLYGGELASQNAGTSPLFGSLGADPGEDNGQVLTDVAGARARLRTPVDGLMVGVSFYSGTPKVGLLGLPIERQYAYLGSIELLRERWSLRSEYGHRDVGSGGEGDAAYVEATYRPVPRWEVAARWDWFDATLGPLRPLPAFLSSLLDHEDLSLGLNYRVTDGFVFMTSVHEVEGNFFAAPPQGVDFAHGGTLDTETRAYQFGAQFSF
jgi:hypothetical protein